MAILRALFWLLIGWPVVLTVAMVAGALALFYLSVLALALFAGFVIDVWRAGPF